MKPLDSYPIRLRLMVGVFVTMVGCGTPALLDDGTQEPEVPRGEGGEGSEGGGPNADGGEAFDAGRELESGLRDGSATDAEHDAGGDAGVPTYDGGMRLFITSAWYSGELGGQAGADAKCQRAAEGALKGGTWKAWLSTPAANASSRLVDVGPFSQEYADGTTSATFANLSGLNSTPLVPIVVDERGGTKHDYGARIYWTGTNVGGAASDDNCSGFTVQTPGKGLAGVSNTTTSEWTASRPYDCAWSNSLLCLEQSHEPPPRPLGTSRKRLFVTRERFDGNLGGLAGADAKCTAAARAAGKLGAWKAWLSTTTEAPASRFVDLGPWYQEFADGHAELVFANVANLGTTPWTPIVVDELGDRRVPISFWSGAFRGDAPGWATCSDFRSNGPPPEEAPAGSTGVTAKWTNSYSPFCYTTHSLLCLEQ